MVVFTLWLPGDFPLNQTAYFLSAKHSGDMYHIRAAQILDPRPLILTEYKAGDFGIESVVAYLSVIPLAAGLRVLAVPWTQTQFTSGTRPTIDKDSVGMYNGQKITAEGLERIIPKDKADRKKINCEQEAGATTLIESRGPGKP